MVDNVADKLSVWLGIFDDKQEFQQIVSIWNHDTSWLHQIPTAAGGDSNYRQKKNFA